jgi:hypothetical protein
MSDSNRGSRTDSINQQVGYALAIILSCMLVGFLAFQEGYRSEARQNRSYEYAEAAKANAIIQCKDLSTSAVADCVYDEMQSAQDQALGQQDLDAQQWMAKWAAFLTLITAVTTIISWVALRYLRDTFSKTAEMAREARDATKAMVAANEIAIQAQRPWLQVEANVREVDIQEHWNSLYVEAIITNIGKMVAERCAVRMAIVNDDTNSTGLQKIDATRIDAEKAALGQLPKGRSPYPMLPQQSEITGVKRESMGLPWQGLPRGDEVLRITLFVAVRYFLPGDDVMRKTDRAFCLTYIPQGAAKDDMMQPFGISRPLPSDLNVETLWLRPAGHNVTT